MKRTWMGILVAAMIVACIYTYGIPDGRQAMTGNLLRFHVIANSDSPGDQALKAGIRDRIIEEVGGRVAGMGSREEVLSFLHDNLDLIERAAREEVQSRGESCAVKAEVGNFMFPTKLYGNIALPAGRYDALRVVIGRGEGANWWCVMFPPLCFVDGKNGVAFARDQDRIMEALTKEEFETLLGSKNMEDVPVRVRFKLVELINKSRVKLAEVFAR